QLLRHQRIDVQVQQRASPNPEQVPMPLSRSQRTHIRLSWPQRLARKERASGAGQVSIKLYNIPYTFTRWLGERASALSPCAGDVRMRTMDTVSGVYFSRRDLHVNQAAAIHFVRERGTSSEQARLTFLLTGQRPSSESMQQFFQDQQEDGSWSPFWAPFYSGLDATCFHLAQAEQMGIRATESAMVRAILFLARRQRPDGAFEEDDAVSNLAPAWVKPGDLVAQLYLTANCGFWLTSLSQTQASAQLAASSVHSFLPADGHLP